MKKGGRTYMVVNVGLPFVVRYGSEIIKQHVHLCRYAGQLSTESLIKLDNISFTCLNPYKRQIIWEKYQPSTIRK